MNEQKLEEKIREIIDVLLLEWGSSLEPDIDFYNDDEKSRIGKGGTLGMVARVLAHDLIIAYHDRELD